LSKTIAEQKVRVKKAKNYEALRGDEIVEGFGDMLE
jgi:hypothetical protein